MSTRITRTQVTFRSPFSLPELAGPQCAGTYNVETEEEGIEGNAHTIYLRVATVIQINLLRSTRFVTIDPVGLEAALERDSSVAIHKPQTDQ